MNNLLEKIFLSVFFLSILCPLSLKADVGRYYLKNYFRDTMTVKGYTGYIFVPSSETLICKNYNLGIHKYNASFNYGIISQGEIGFTVKVDETDMFKKMELNVKYNFFPWKINSSDCSLYKVKLAAGIKHHTFYLVGGKHFSNFYHFGLQGGLNFDNLDSKHFEITPLLAFYKIIYKSMFIFDYDDYKKQYNVGGHFLLSPNFKLDIFIINLNKKFKDMFDNIVFGLSFSG